jgi:hypothetical protein
VFISDPRVLQEILVKEHGTIFTHPPGHLEYVELKRFPVLVGLIREPESITLFLVLGFSVSLVRRIIEYSLNTRIHCLLGITHKLQRKVGIKSKYSL